TPAHFPERRELRFDVAHRVDPIAGRVVEVVRLAEAPSADVQGAGVAENAVRKRLADDAGAELERGGTETLDGRADRSVAKRRAAMRVQRDDRPLEAVLGGAACEAVLREAPTVRVAVPREAVGLQPFHDRPEAGVDRRLAAGDDRAPEAGAMEEGGTPEERLG